MGHSIEEILDGCIDLYFDLNPPILARQVGFERREISPTASVFELLMPVFSLGILNSLLKILFFVKNYVFAHPTLCHDLISLKLIDGRQVFPLVMDWSQR